MGIDPDMDSAFFKESNENDVLENFQKQVFSFYEEKNERLANTLYPIVKNVQENEGHRYKYIAIPFSDGSKRQMPIAAGLEDAVQSEGKSIMQDIEKTVTLALIDNNWKEHLRSMDELKDSVQAASFEQKDPLVVYKMEAYELFENLIYLINQDVTSYLLKGKLLIQEPREIEEAKRQRTDLRNVRTNRGVNPARAAAEAVSRGKSKPETFKRSEKKVGRNDPCPCGSGKKFKHCHGRH
jgi:preprotein translocase subunit SecA